MTTIKQRIAQNSILVVPACFDMVSAKLIEHCGFEAVYLSGYGHTASHLGLPDAGLITFTEMLERLRHLVRAVGIPVLADGDTGFGGVINVRRTILEYESAGAQAIQIEDQEMPKKCGHTPGKRLVSATEMVRKIEAALAARRSDEFLIIARTDAASVSGLDDAIRRGHLYESAGADIIFIESPATEEDVKRIAGSFDTPLMLNQIENGKTPLLPVRQLERLGYKIVAYALTALMASVKAVRQTLTTLRCEGSAESYLSGIASFEELNQLLGFPEVHAWEKRFRWEEP